MKKILIDGRFYGLENAGLGRYSMGLIDSLAESKDEMSYSVLLRQKYFNQLNLPDNWEKVLVGFRHYSVSEQTKLPRIIRNQQPDLVHFPHFNVPIGYRGKYVVTIHDLVMHKHKGREATTLPFYKYHAKRAGYKYVFKKAVTGAQLIIVPSQFVKKELVDTYKLSKDKVKVIYEGVDDLWHKTSGTTSSKKYNLPAKYFIYTGNAYPHKNLATAVEAMVTINKESKSKVVLAIVSSRNVFAKRLEKLISQKKAGEYVKLLGFVPDKELRALYRNSLAFVYPSLYEGFGLPALEAMASGTLAVVSNIPVFKEIYDGKAIFFDPKSPVSLHKALCAVVDMKAEQRKKLVADNRKFVKKYSWSKMAEETHKVYEQVLTLV